VDGNEKKKEEEGDRGVLVPHNTHKKYTSGGEIEKKPTHRENTLQWQHCPRW